MTNHKRRTAQVVLAIMAGMAALALVFALMTQERRRKNDFKGKATPLAAFVEEPSRLAGLAYLPKGCNVAAAVQFAALLRDDGGRALLREPRPALLELMLKPLARTGVSLADVDHIIMGSAASGFEFHATTVIVTRKPYEPALVKQAVDQQPVKTATYRNRTLYKLTDPPGAKLWCADARVLVYTTVTREEMERIPTAVKEPAETLTPAARDALTARLDKQSRIWAVGDLAPAKDLIALLQLGPLKEQAHLLTLVQAFDVGITTGEAQLLTVRGDFFTGNPAATEELAKYLKAVTINGAKSQKVETPPADLHSAEAQWVSWQLRSDADALREAVGKLSLTPPKQRPR